MSDTKAHAEKGLSSALSEIGHIGVMLREAEEIGTQKHHPDEYRHLMALVHMRHATVAAQRMLTAHTAGLLRAGYPAERVAAAAGRDVAEVKRWRENADAHDQMIAARIAARRKDSLDASNGEG